MIPQRLLVTGGSGFIGGDCSGSASRWEGAAGCIRWISALRSMTKVGALISPVLTVLCRPIRFDVCRRCLAAKRPIDADSSQNSSS